MFVSVNWFLFKVRSHIISVRLYMLPSPIVLYIVHQYVINENNLSAVDKHKHLGIWIESSLRWDAHINYIVGKAN